MDVILSRASSLNPTSATTAIWGTLLNVKLWNAGCQKFQEDFRNMPISFPWKNVSLPSRPVTGTGVRNPCPKTPSPSNLHVAGMAPTPVSPSRLSNGWLGKNTSCASTLPVLPRPRRPRLTAFVMRVMAENNGCPPQPKRSTSMDTTTTTGPSALSTKSTVFCCTGVLARCFPDRQLFSKFHPVCKFGEVYEDICTTECQ